MEFTPSKELAWLLRKSSQSWFCTSSLSLMSFKGVPSVEVVCPASMEALMVSMVARFFVMASLTRVTISSAERASPFT